MLTFDVADSRTDRFIATIRMKVNPLFRLSLQEVISYVYTKMPTLKYRDIKLEFKDETT